MHFFPMPVNARCYKEEEKASFEVMNKQHFCYEMCSNMSSLLNVNCQLMAVSGICIICTVRIYS